VADQYYIEQGYYTPDGYFVYIADADLTANSSGTLTATVGLNADGSATISASATFACDATRLRTKEVDAALSSAVTTTAEAVKTTDVQSTQSSEFTQTATAYRIIEAQASFSGAFTPTLTAEAIKNHTAILDVIASMTTMAVANRATSMAVDSQANLDAQAAKTVDIQSTPSSTATISIIGTAVNSAASSLVSTATLTAQAFNVQFGQSSVASTASIFTSRYFGTGRPRNLTNVNGSTTDSFYKFGTRSLAGQFDLSYVSNSAKGTIPAAGTDFVYEIYYYKTGNTARNLTFWTAINPNVNAFFTLAQNSSGQIVFTPRGPGTTLTSSALSNSAWHHLMIVKNSTSLSFYVNGTRAGTFAWSGVAWNGRTAESVTMRLNGDTGFYLDEVSLHFNTTLGYDPDQTTITVPTTARVNDPDTTVFLYHFDDSGFDTKDDITVSNIASAALTSTVTLTAQAQEVSGAQATLSAASTVTVLAGKSAAASADMSVAASLTAQAGFNQSQSSTQSAEFTQTATVVKTTDTASSHSADTTVAAEVTRTRDVEISLSGAFTPTLSVDVFKNHTAILETSTSLAAVATTSVDAAASITADSSLSANGSITKETSVSVSVTASMVTDMTRVRFAQGDFTTNAAVSVQAGQEQQATAALSVEFAISITAYRQRAFDSTELSTAILQLTSANVYRNLGDQTLTATASVSADVTNRIGFNISLNTAATVSAVAVKTTDTGSTQASEFAQSATAVKTVAPAVNFAAIATQLTGIGYNATGTILLESQFTVQALAGKIIPYPENGITGVHTDPVALRRAQIVDLDSYTRETGMVMMIWARKTDTAVLQAPFFSTDNVSGSAIRFEFYNQTTARFVVIDSGTVEYFTWPSAVPTDTDWHQYILHLHSRYIDSNSFQRSRMDLYRDGEFIGSSDIRLGVEWTVFGNINLGYAPASSPEGLAAKYFTGDLAQTWISTLGSRSTPNQYGPGTTSNLLDLALLYNQGAIDLGTDGRNFNTLPTPWFYSPVTRPYTDILYLEDGLTRTVIPADQVLALPDMQARASMTTSFVGVFLYTADLTATSAVTTAAVKTVQAQATINTVASLTCAAAKTVGVISDQASAFIVQADVNLGIANGAGLFDHQSSLSVITGYLRQQTATAQAEATITAEATVIPPLSGDAALTVFASQTTVAGYLISALSTQTASTTATIEATLIDPVRAIGSLFVMTEITVTAERIRPGISLEVSAATLTAEATVIPPIRASADLTSTFTLTANVSGNFNTITLVMSTGTLAVQPVKTARPTSQIASTATLQAIPGTRIGIVAVLQATGFVLTAGDVINIDPALTLRILAETRTLIIDSETRTIMIRPESRTLTIEEIT